METGKYFCTAGRWRTIFKLRVIIDTSVASPLAPTPHHNNNTHNNKSGSSLPGPAGPGGSMPVHSKMAQASSNMHQSTDSLLKLVQHAKRKRVAKQATAVAAMVYALHNEAQSPGCRINGRLLRARRVPMDWGARSRMPEAQFKRRYRMDLPCFEKLVDLTKGDMPESKEFRKEILLSAYLKIRICR